MAPFHETDLAENRWAQAEWENFELWERVEQRQRRRRWIWIGLAAGAFVLVSSVPTVIDRAPKWATLAVTRQLALEIGRIKIESALARKPFRIRVLSDQELGYEVEKLESCADSRGEPVRKGTLRSVGWSQAVSLVDPGTGGQAGIPGLVRDLCYDPLGTVSPREPGISAFAFAPVTDLANGRLDRTSILLLSGPLSESSFE